MIFSRILWLQVQCLKDDLCPMKKPRENSGIFHRHGQDDFPPPESCCASCMSLSTLACSWFRWSLSKNPKKSGTPDNFIGKIWQTWHIYGKKHGVNISGLVLLGKWKSGASCWNSPKKKIEDSGFEDGWSALQLAPFLTQGRIPTKD